MELRYGLLRLGDYTALDGGKQSNRILRSSEEKKRLSIEILCNIIIVRKRLMMLETDNLGPSSSSEINGAEIHHISTTAMGGGWRFRVTRYA